MGYPVSPLSPKITIQGRTFCVSAFEWPTPVGTYFKVGIYEQMPDGGWNEVQALSTYNNAGDALADLHKIGGGMKYIDYVVTQTNAFFSHLFGGSHEPVSNTEPTTDAEAKAYMTSHLGALKFTLVGGVPVLG